MQHYSQEKLIIIVTGTITIYNNTLIIHKNGSNQLQHQSELVITDMLPYTITTGGKLSEAKNKQTIITLYEVQIQLGH